MTSPFFIAPSDSSSVELVRAGVLAPSPDNNQPWQFNFNGDALEVHLDRSRSLPSDVNAMYDLMSVGTVVENIAIAAGQQRLQTEIEFPAEGDSLTLSGESPL